MYTLHTYIQTYFIQPFYPCGAPDDYTGDYFITLRNERKKNVTYNNLYYARRIHAVYIISYEYLLRADETYLIVRLSFTTPKPAAAMHRRAVYVRRNRVNDFRAVSNINRFIIN